MSAVNSLPSFRDLLSRSWQKLRADYRSLLLLLAPVFASVGWRLLASAYHFGSQSIAAYIAYLLISLILVVVAIWATASVIFFLKQGQGRGVIAAYKGGASYLKSGIWLSVLTTLALLGAFVPLLVPFVWALVVFSFGLYVIVIEDQKGLAALTRSAALVRGRWWRVFSRYLFFWLVVIVAPAVLAILASIIGWIIEHGSFATLAFKFALDGPESVTAIKVVYALFGLYVFGLALPFSLTFSFSLFSDLVNAQPIQSGILPAKKFSFSRALVCWGLAVIILPIIWMAANQGDEEFKYGYLMPLKKVEVPDSENAFFKLRELGSGSTADDFEKGTVIKTPIDFAGVSTSQLFTEYIRQNYDINSISLILENLHKRNGQALQILHEMAGYNHFQFPAYKDPEKLGPNSTFYAIGTNPQELARFIALDSIRLANEGNANQAYQQLFDLLKVGYLMRNAEPANPLISFLIGVGVDRVAYQGVFEVAKIAPPKNEKAIEYIAIIQKLANYSETGQRAAQSEALFSPKFSNLNDYLVALDDTGELNKKLPFIFRIHLFQNYFFKKNQFRNMVATSPAALYETFETCQPSAISPLNDGKLRSGYPFSLLAPGGFSKFLATIFFFAIGSNPARDACTLQFYANATQVIFAIRAFQQEHGGVLPASLAELKSAYLAEIPSDPYAQSESIKYTPEKGLLYSIGFDQKDSGGYSVSSAVNDEPSINLTDGGTLFTNWQKRLKENSPQPAQTPESLLFQATVSQLPVDLKNRDEQRLAGLKEMVDYLEKFNQKYGIYPVSFILEKVEKNSFGLKLGSAEPLSLSGWYYGYKSDGFSFELTARLESPENKNLCDPAVRDICLYKVTNTTK